MAIGKKDDKKDLKIQLVFIRMVYALFQPYYSYTKPLDIILKHLKSIIKTLILIFLTFHFGCTKKKSLDFKVSTNYSEGKSYLIKTKTIENPKSKIDIFFFKKHFNKFYGLPKKLINKKLKNQEITEWNFKDKPQELEENWKEVYTYDSAGRLIEYKYSGCIICSQMPWGYKLFYNKDDDIIEQQIYFLEKKFYVEKDKMKINYVFNNEMNSNIKLTYNNRNIIKFEKRSNNEIEELIELIE